MKLKFQFIPKNSIVDVLEEQEKETIILNANCQCQICKAKTCDLDAQEIWEYNYLTEVQKLITVKAVCKECKDVINVQQSISEGKLNDIFNHLIKVNNISNLEGMILHNNLFDSFQSNNKVKKWKVKK